MSPKKKKTVLITGCSDNGLGAALAIAFHNTGTHRVLATARNTSKLSQIKSHNIEYLELDVLSPSSMAATFSAVNELTGGKLDILINNAGLGLLMPITDLEIDEVRKLFEVNVFSYITVTQAFLPLLRGEMLDTDESANSDNVRKSDTVATIINQTSIGGLFAMPFHGAYSASKAAASMISETLRHELAPFNIRVVELKTGVVKSNFFTNASKKDSATPNRLPDNSLFAVAREAIEKTMNGEELFANASKADVWAGQVVGDLTRRSPPRQIWRGAEAGLVWWLMCLPIPTTWFDEIVRAKSGLGEIARRLRGGR